jgi:uncharacterized protein YjbJ (UPF0337 family)
MDTHRISGAVKEVAGTVQEAAGAIVGDAKTRREGQARKVEGQAERTFGEWLDEARDIIRAHPLSFLAGAGLLLFAVGALRRTDADES